MSSYDMLVNTYDELFPLNAAMVRFVENQFDNQVSGLKLLDAGCGTGSLAIALARHGAGVKGFDLNANMILKAEEKRPPALNLSFEVGSLTNVEQLYAGQIFDGIMCVGNTLVHLPYHDTVERFFAQVANLLKPGGKFILQIVNYDNIMKNRPASLPLIQTEKYHFERLYEYPDKGVVRFVTRLQHNSEAEVLIQNTLLLACERNFLEDALKKHFSTVSFFGSFDGAAWSEDTFHTIVAAVK